MNWSEWFYIDETSPTGLRWAVERLGGRAYNVATVSPTDVAGCVCNTSGYGIVKLDGVNYQAHRVMWEMVNGPIPEGFEIDHINGRRSDNRIDNFRCVTRSANMKNKRINNNNTSGVQGVSLLRHADNRRMHWKAKWTDFESGKVRFKYFPVHKLGNDEAFRQACEHRANMIAQMNNSGAGYTDRHGKGVEH